jgi:hypothetical protein
MSFSFSLEGEIMNFRRLFQRLIASRFASRSLLFLLLAALFAGGLQLRWLTWEKTTHLRFHTTS